jgi:hypothetical protein
MEAIVFSQYTIDFARVALEYCAFVEKTADSNKAAFVADMTKILPLLYLKASIIPEITENYESDLRSKVDENLYARIEKNIADLLGDDDVYPEAFRSEEPFGDLPAMARLSEDLADMFQDLGDFIAVFKNGQQETMNDALLLCIEHFRKYWGQRLVNALRALHHIQYKPIE